jgi:hypothetical protein
VPLYNITMLVNIICVIAVRVPRNPGNDIIAPVDSVDYF